MFGWIRRDHACVVLALLSLAASCATAAKLVPPKMLANIAATNFAERFDMAIPGNATRPIPHKFSLKTWVVMGRNSGAGRA